MTSSGIMAASNFAGAWLQKLPFCLSAIVAKSGSILLKQSKFRIWLLNNKLHGLFPSGGHRSPLTFFDQGFQKIAGRE